MADDLGRARVPPVRPKQRVGAGAGDTTRVAPLFSPRRNVNPAARRRSVAALALVCGLLLAMVVAAIVLAAPARVRMPALHGLGGKAVAAKLRRVHLKWSFTRIYDRARPGTAIGQTPAAGTLVEEGSTVRFVLSKGPPPVEVPRLVGQSSDSARAILESLGLDASARSVPAPGTQPGQVTSQSPTAGGYVSRHATVRLSVAETPRWRPVTYFSGTSSVPFTIRAKQWRVVYRMGFVGTCSLVIFCDGPTAHVIRPGSGHDSVADFGMNDGDPQTQTFQSGPGTYQVTVSPGSDTTRWSFEVDDYY
jgi:PASTA domain